ncbi:hypothetical protein CMK11_01620 [Candidatus Poribacteria bacterium]|nr:hypothetical protein [Candidatus Poribacteria bacterium]
MFVFFVVERFVFGHRGSVIWSDRYYDADWQRVFDLFNSLPLLGLAAVVAYVFHRRRVAWAFVSMALHAAMDLPLHNDDGHRHFYPFSDFRFDSPVSYWDPAHFGAYAATGEAVAVLIASAVVYRRLRSRWTRGALILVDAAYVAMCAGIWMWSRRSGVS